MNRPRDLPERFESDLPSPISAHRLDALLTPERARLYRQVLARRTSRIAVVVEDCYDPHNATAVSRTCDAFGVSRLHAITTENAFRINPKVSQGAHRHIDLRVHDHIGEAYKELRDEGFRILVSDLQQTEVLGPRDLERALVDSPLALVFGRETTGVTADAIAGADGFFKIPMVGLTRSLNVSVSVAVTLYAMRENALNENSPGDLSTADQLRLYEQWVSWFNERGSRGVEEREELEIFDARRVGRNGNDTEDLPR